MKTAYHAKSNCSTESLNPMKYLAVFEAKSGIIHENPSCRSLENERFPASWGSALFPGIHSLPSPGKERLDKMLFYFEQTLTDANVRNRK